MRRGKTNAANRWARRLADTPAAGACAADDESDKGQAAGDKAARKQVQAKLETKVRGAMAAVVAAQQRLGKVRQKKESRQLMLQKLQRELRDLEAEEKQIETELSSSINKLEAYVEAKGYLEEAFSGTEEGKSESLQEMGEGEAARALPSTPQGAGVPAAPVSPPEQAPTTPPDTRRPSSKELSASRSFPSPLPAADPAVLAELESLALGGPAVDGKAKSAATGSKSPEDGEPGRRRSKLPLPRVGKPKGPAVARLASQWETLQSPGATESTSGVPRPRPKPPSTEQAVMEYKGRESSQTSEGSIVKALSTLKVHGFGRKIAEAKRKGAAARKAEPIPKETDSRGDGREPWHKGATRAGDTSELSTDEEE